MLSALLLAGGAAGYAPSSVWAPSRTGRSTVHRVRAMAEEESDWSGAATWSDKFKEPEAIFDVEAVKKVLPHRYPFLLVDKIIEFEPGKRAVGVKKASRPARPDASAAAEHVHARTPQVTTNEEFFNGHFPDRAIMPGVLQVESGVYTC